MRVGLLISVGLALVAVIVAWIIFGGTTPLEARFALADCRKISLRDAETGKLIKGAEDMLFLPDGDTLVVAAYDRADEVLPFTGIFGVSLLDIDQGTEEITVEELIKSYNLQGGVKPQGIAINASGDRLAIINRVGPEYRTVIDVMEWQGDLFRRGERHEHEAFCRANDLTFDLSGNLLITRDRAQCRLSVIDMVPFYATGILLTLTPEGELSAGEERYMFPNGIVMGPTGNPIIAETRAARLSGGYVDTVLPGGPDNLTVDDQGALIAAVHPSLWQLFLYLNGFAFSSPSRVIRADPERTDIEVLFDDPDGELMSAVSVGVMFEDRLYMGSAVDEGILVCQK